MKKLIAILIINQENAQMRFSCELIRTSNDNFVYSMIQTIIALKKLYSSLFSVQTSAYQLSTDYFFYQKYKNQLDSRMKDHLTTMKILCCGIFVCIMHLLVPCWFLLERLNRVHSTPTLQVVTINYTILLLPQQLSLMSFITINPLVKCLFDNHRSQFNFS